MSGREQEEELSEQDEENPTLLPGQETMPPASGKEIRCKYCGEGPFKTMGALGVHSRKCPKRKEAMAKKKSPEKPTTVAAEGVGEEPSVYKGETDTNGILRSILTKHPDITEKVLEEVMDWAELRGQLHPTELVTILLSMRGITSATANIIAQKYALAIQKAQNEGKLVVPGGFFLGPSTGTGQPGGSLVLMPGLPVPPGAQQPGVGQQLGYGQPGGYPPPPGYYQPPPTIEQIRTIIRDEMRVREPAAKPREEDPIIEIEEPVRNDQGQIIVNDDNQPFMKKIRAPASKAELLTTKEDMELKVMDKMERYRKLFGGEQLTIEKIRELIREERQSKEAPAEAITKADVEKASQDAAATAVKAVRDEIDKEKKEDERFKNLERAIERSGSSRTVEGYHDDTVRLLGQGLSEAANIARDRKPVELIIREVGPILTGKEAVGHPGEVPPGATPSGDAFQRLQEKGWVAEE